MTYYGEAISSTSQDPDKIENISKSELKDLLITQESFASLVEKTKEVNTKESEVVHNVHLAELYADIPMMDSELVLQHTPLLPGINPYKPKLNKTNPHIALKEELQKLWDMEFINTIDYG